MSRSLGLLFLVLFLGAAAFLAAACEAKSTAKEAPPTRTAARAPPWPAFFVGRDAVPVDEAGNPDAVVVLDVRDRGAFGKGHINGAHRADWTRWRQGLLLGGLLPDDTAAIAKDLAELGVDEGKRVLVCGNPMAPASAGGWGEDGRVAWLVAWLGHPAVAVLDGGCATWQGSAAWTTTDAAIVPGHFTARPQPLLRSRKAAVVAASATGNATGNTTSNATGNATAGAVIIDVRTEAEWNGATPYFEARGGRIPGAVHVAVMDLVDETGRRRPVAELQHTLSAQGIGKDTPLIVYCTGGVRSGWATLALRDAGYTVSNYDGSFWEWADDKTLPVETSGSKR